MNIKWDVLGLGCATVDDLLYVEQFPAPDVKTRVLRSERQGGGLTATALVAASRLGARCAYAAMLGHDEYSQFVADNLRRENIDLSQVVWHDDARPIHSVIVVDTQRHTRNIFFEINGAVGAHDELPQEEVIRAARVLFLDHYGTTGGIRAARIARAAGIPVVADLERENVPRFHELLELVDHLIVSQAFALRFTSTRCASDAALALWNASRQVVVVTCGAQGCWSVQAENRIQARHHLAFEVETVDTTGCGDVFHGAYALALARGCALHERLRFASAAAALKATQHGAQAGIPARADVEDFLQQSSG
ncbi:MAG TPA: PfkB family carbohydrate kinase [Abditibacteriaceae bacterium]|jgi:sugar/nucleoside kinase (ribokinase family)